ncbi:uncharacterized protein ACN2A1_010456 isoform 1-T13 [Glossina fuscipes fuscipes]
MSKSGFSTLNRWLGRKNKEKSTPNGKLSKSSNNLSISSSNISDTSQLEYNRITPLPVATSKAPFEQTFRITVLLPKDQLYVTRVGARTPLTKLLELVCDNKSLDIDKYEFRNPVDPSQVYSCDLTIGAVGLSEIRLCHKSESYDTFNADEIIKLRRTSIIRDSLTSSEFSSRISKHTTTKTTSPYSSTNSLNSMDSSGLNYTRTPIIAPTLLKKTVMPKVTAPPRKKRAAPRPPSQQIILEKSPPIIENGEVERDDGGTLSPNEEFRKRFTSESILNLSPLPDKSQQSDINGNNCHKSEEMETNKARNQREYDMEEERIYESVDSNGYTDDTVLYAQVQKKNALNLQQGGSSSGSTLTLNSSVSETWSKFPEPCPRKRIVQIKKKSAPAPPPRNSLCPPEDNVSLKSVNASSSSCEDCLQRSLKTDGLPPKPLERETNQSHTSLNTLTSDRDVNVQDIKNIENLHKMEQIDLPKPVPRMTSTTLLNATDVENDLKNLESDNNQSPKMISNVSKVILNRTPTPEPRSLSSEVPEEDSCFGNQHIDQLKSSLDDDNVSKQADSGIGEPVPSPVPDSLPSDVSALECKSNFESSSDDDDMVKVYNFKLGKTLVKPLNETQTTEELTVVNSGQEGIENKIVSPNAPSELNSWNFGMPISPPPNFADFKALGKKEEEKKTDKPITPKILERPMLNFEILQKEEEGLENRKDIEAINKSSEALPEAVTAIDKGRNCKKDDPLKSPTAPLNGLVEELSLILQEKGVDSLIKKPTEQLEIQAVKPNPLNNFTITPLVINNYNPKDISNETKINSSPSPTNSLGEDEKLYRKRGSVTSLKQRRSISRADSFHCTNPKAEVSGLNNRSSSQLSLHKLEQNTVCLNRRRSSSELSIGESPSLQSLEVIKTILSNKRKSSITQNSDDELITKDLINSRRPSQELQFTSLELKPKYGNERNLNQDIKECNETKANLELVAKEQPKFYKYTGPPSVNVGTWNERPKVQVAIKNEGDYIFGGKSSDALKNVMQSPKINRQTERENLKTTSSSSRPALLQRLGITEHDFKVPVTVKPLKDLKTDDNITKLQRDEKRPTVEAVLRPQTQTIVNLFALPRNVNRYSMPAVPNNTLLRSTSITQNDKRRTVVEEKVVTAPFGQNTLRRTGLKEKILAKEEQRNQEQQPNVRKIETPKMNGEIRPSPSEIPANKLNLNLKKTNSMLLENPSVRGGKAMSSTTGSPTTIPMAPQMQIKLKSLKIESNSMATSPSSEPKEQLLEAIRNFNKTQLKKC